MNKFLLSTGRTTTSEAEYIIDLFRLYLSLTPGDIPGAPDLGFNFTFAGIPKSELRSKLEFRAGAFVKKLQNSFPGHTILLTSIDLVSEDLVRLEITVDNTEHSGIYVNIYENS